MTRVRFYFTVETSPSSLALQLRAYASMVPLVMAMPKYEPSELTATSCKYKRGLGLTLAAIDSSELSAVHCRVWA